MLQSWAIILSVSLIYIGVLFAIAYYGDKRADAGHSLVNNPYVYALSLAVYCTTWTFYGSVGRAVSTGIGFLPIYLGPTLMVALWWFVLRKIIRISKVDRITSIADFVGSRYGKSGTLAGLVTIIAVVGIIPYISLQLEAISSSFTVLWHYPHIVMPPPIGAIFTLREDTAFYVAMLLAAFAILFGTRHLDVTEHHEGLVAAVAFESLVKLLAFLAVGVFVTFGLYRGFGDLFTQAQALPEAATLFNAKAAGSFSSWIGLTLVSMLAIMFLPRQFQMAVVENIDEGHLNKAIWLFPLYMLVINIFVLPIAFSGLLQFPERNVNADLFVLAVPMANQQQALALFVFLGGLSAGTGMVIVESVALSTMVSNDLVMPVLLRLRIFRLDEWEDLGWLMLTIRRVAIMMVLLLGYIYLRLTGGAYSLVSIGLMSFTAVAQFAPAILGGIYWKDGTRSGVLVGLVAGFSLWIYTLFLPSLIQSGWLPLSFLENGPYGISWLRPDQLLGLEGFDRITHALFWSLLVNLAGYVGVSLLGQPSAIEHSQARLFVDVFEQSTEEDRRRLWRGTASAPALQKLLGRFLGARRAQEDLTRYARQRGLNWSQLTEADGELVNHAENLLSGAIGAASARVMIASVVKEEPLSIEEVMDILDETSKVIKYSHQLEEKSQELEKATSDLRAANDRLKELDRLKDDFISTITHELRTPLTSIRAFSEILHDNPELPVERRGQFLGIILKESERLTRLINQVLDLSKIEAGKLEWNVSDVNLREVVEESLVATSQLFNEKQIRLEVELLDNVPSVTADRDRIIQVMINLLSNAIKFCDSGAGWVGVRLHQRINTLQVDVSDNGRGIKPEETEIVFEKFRQVGDALTDKPQGTGLGLPISRHIITHFNGRLWVESTPGQGATFSFTLPCKNGSGPEHQQEPNPNPTTNRREDEAYSRR
jgi:hypothetical protein